MAIIRVNISIDSRAHRLNTSTIPYGIDAVLEGSQHIPEYMLEKILQEATQGFQDAILAAVADQNALIASYD